MTSEKREGSVASRFKEEDLKRVAPGVWEDKKTGRRVAGGAYEADTGAGQMIQRALEEGEAPEELEKAQEELEAEDSDESSTDAASQDEEAAEEPESEE